MKTFNKTLIAAALLTTGAAAQADVSGSIGIASSYLFRGFDLSDGSAAVSGSLDYAHDSGLYAGVWGSSGDDSYGTEYDLYAGFAGELSGFGYDIGYIDYNYPSNDDTNANGDTDFEEWYIGASYDAFGAYIYDGIDADYTYLNLSVSYGDFTLAYGDFISGDDFEGSHVDLTYALGDLAFTVSKASGESYETAGFSGEETQFVVSYSLPIDL